MLTWYPFFGVLLYGMTLRMQKKNLGPCTISSFEIVFNQVYRNNVQFCHVIATSTKQFSGDGNIVYMYFHMTF